MTNLSPISRNCCAKRIRTGFSLVETTIAIGIFSFCIVSIVWLMGTTLTASHESQTDTALASILRSLDAMVHTLPQGADQTQPMTYWFTSEGNPSGASDLQTQYQATLTPVPRAQAQAFAGVPEGSDRFHLWQVVVTYPSPAYVHKYPMLLSRTYLGQPPATP